MQIEVKLVGEKNASPRDRKSLAVETHMRRNDVFVVQKVDNVLEGDSVVFNVPAGGRLVVTTPEATEDLVYDRDQAAAVRPSAQRNDDSKADAPKGATPPSNPQPQVQTRQTMFNPNAPQQPAPSGLQPRPQMRAEPTPQHPSAPSKLEKQKAAQQTAPRPAGESPPLPGSPVGSPPHGNGGKDNK